MEIRVLNFQKFTKFLEIKYREIVYSLLRDPWWKFPFVLLILLPFTPGARPEAGGSRTVQCDQELCRLLRLHGHHLRGQVMQQPLCCKATTYTFRQDMQEPLRIIENVVSALLS